MSRSMRVGPICLALLALAPIGCWDEKKDPPRGEAGRDVIKSEEARLTAERQSASRGPAARATATST